MARSSNPHVGRDYRLEVLSSFWLRKTDEARVGRHWHLIHSIPPSVAVVGAPVATSVCFSRNEGRERFAFRLFVTLKKRLPLLAPGPDRVPDCPWCDFGEGIFCFASTADCRWST